MKKKNLLNLLYVDIVIFVIGFLSLWIGVNYINMNSFYFGFKLVLIGLILQTIVRLKIPREINIEIVVE